MPCRTGNWAEDEYLSVLKTQEHLEKSGVGLLNSQKLSNMMNDALKPVALAPDPSDGAIHFGDVVMCVLRF